jgi:hypothetical protein
MEGDERARLCLRCSGRVYDLSVMNEDEAESFLTQRLDDEEPDVRLYRRPDGRVLTSECPRGLRARHRRRIAGAALMTLAVLSGIAWATADLRLPTASERKPLSRRFEVPRRPVSEHQTSPQPRPRVRQPPIRFFKMQPDPDEAWIASIVDATEGDVAPAAQ